MLGYYKRCLEPNMSDYHCYERDPTISDYYQLCPLDTRHCPDPYILDYCCQRQTAFSGNKEVHCGAAAQTGTQLKSTITET